MKWLQYIVVGLFMTIIMLPILGDLTGVKINQGLSENRFIKGYEDLSLPQKLSLYIKNFDRQFWGREYLVKSYITVKKDFFGISPLPDKVVIGKEGWLYLSDYGAIDDYRNARPFSFLQLDSIQKSLKKAADELNLNGIKFFVVVVPDKHTIYPEFLPGTVKKVRSISRLQQLTDHLTHEQSFQFINLTDTLLAAKQTGSLYFKEESHWNDRGSFVGYQKTLKHIKSYFPEIKILSIDSCETFMGEENDLDLAKLLGKSLEYTEETIKISPLSTNRIQAVDADVVIPPAKRFNPNYAFRRINPQSTGPSVVVYRDSFFSSLTPFFEQSFSTSTYIWTNDIDLEYIRAQNVQLVLLEIAERHIDLLAH